MVHRHFFLLLISALKYVQTFNIFNRMQAKNIFGKDLRNSIPADGNIFKTSDDSIRFFSSIETEFRVEFLLSNLRWIVKQAVLDMRHWIFTSQHCILISPFNFLSFLFQLWCHSKWIWSAFWSTRRSRFWLPQPS